MWKENLIKPRESKFLRAAFFFLVLLLGISYIIIPKTRRQGEEAIRSGPSFSGISSMKSLNTRCRKQPAPTMAWRSPQMRVQAIKMPSQNSHEAVKSVIKEQLGIINDQFAENLIMKSLMKMEWEKADDDDEKSLLATTMNRPDIAELKIQIGDPYSESERIIHTLEGFGFDKEAVKGCITQYPMLLRLQPEKVEAVAQTLLEFGMSSNQLKQIIRASPILAYDAERHVKPALKKFKKRTKMSDRSIATLIAMQPKLLTDLIDTMWSLSRSTMLLNDAYEAQFRKYARKTTNINSLDDTLEDMNEQDILS